MISGLDGFKTYNLAMELGEKVWSMVNNWDKFSKDTIGKQLVRCVDSIAANLAEGLGRFHYKEARNFGYFARGSLFESKSWITKAHTRKLITETQFEELIIALDTIGKMINGYIKSIGQVSEPEESYGLRSLDFFPNH